MSTAPLSEARPASALVVRPLRDGVVAAGAILLALIVLYAVFLDQGQLLSPVLGKLAHDANYLHEFAHDGRHLLGAPCH